jgi:hypothetical protein
MLLRAAENIRQCLDQAAEARKCAQEATDLESKAQLLDMERRWLRLVETYRLIEQMERFIADGKRESP